MLMAYIVKALLRLALYAFFVPFYIFYKKFLIFGSPLARYRTSYFYERAQKGGRA